MIEVEDNVLEAWRPHKRQEDYISINDAVFEALYGGAAGGGKSELLLQLPVCRGWYKHPRWKGIIFRRTFPELEKSIIKRSHEMGIFKALGAKYNGQEHCWNFPSGASLRFSYLNSDKDAYDHKSAEYNYAGFDELTSFTEFQYLYIGSRIRSSVKELPAIQRGATNPGGVGHSWVRARFVEPARDGYRLLYDSRSNTYRYFVPAKLTDNPYLMEADPNYINRLMSLPEAERKALMDGDWWAFAGQVFNEWRENGYPDEPRHAVHVVDEFPIPSYWPKIIAMDWGFTHMTWVGWFAVSPDRRVFLYREYSCKKKYIEEWGADILRASQFDGNIVRKVIDPSARQNRGTPMTIAQQLSTATGWEIDDADNDRIGGKLLLHEFLRWKERPPRYIPKEGYNHETAGRIMRMYGTDALHEYENMFVPDKPENNLPKLQVFRQRCPEFIKVIPLCVYDEKKAEDVAKFDGDDAYDGGRYGIKAVDEFFKKSENAHFHHQSVAAIMRDFDQNKDYNQLVHRMEQLENEEVDSPVSRFHDEAGRPYSEYGARYTH